MRLLHPGLNHIVTSRLLLLPLAVWAGACAPGARGTSTAPAPASAPVRVESLPPVTLEYPASSTGTTARATSNVDEFARLDRMDWPGPNSYRGANGAPGPAYWQQRANYDIRATLDTGARRIRGHVTITYTNNSPDTLRSVWLQLDQNLYRTGSRGSALYPQDSRWGVHGFQGGYEITDLRVNGKSAASRVNDTMMQVMLDAPLAPRGATTTLAMDFTFRVPDHGSDRMGRDGTLYEIAQWYPRMAVY
ncbi:MAG: hypothetical protein ACRENC_15590, partial [Gemmatimonadaceae bacterium]